MSDLGDLSMVRMLTVEELTDYMVAEIKELMNSIPEKARTAILAEYALRQKLQEAAN